MIITHKLQPMDLTHKQNTARVDVVQDDKYSRNVEFTLTSNGVAWQIPDGTAAVVRYKKPDGTGGNYDALPDGSTAYQINGNVLTVALAPQVCTVSGSVQLSVGLIKGNAEINTFSVNIVVHPNPGAEYQSEDYIRLSGAVPNSGWTPNMYLGTDASGNVVAKEGTSGGGGTVSVDSTLTKSGQAADSAVVGNRLSALSEEIANLQTSGLTTAQVNALDGMFKIAAYTEDASTAYAAFKTAFGLSGDPGGGGDTETTYKVTNNLTNVTNSNSATTASGYYSATLSVEDGYTISVIITMGGVDITDSVYTEDGTILITEVTGDIVITATAELASAYTVLYQLADTPKSVSGLSEDTGITFGAEDANGYTKALTICIAYTGFDANETLMKMSSGKAVEVTTNSGGSNTQIRVTSCSNAVTVNPEISDSGDYRVIITKEAISFKTLKIHTLSSGVVAMAENVGTYGNFSHSVCAGNLIVGDSNITVNKLMIYEGILSDAHIATFLSGGDV